MVMAMVTDTPGDTAMDTVGTPVIVITRTTDMITSITDMVAIIQRITIQVTDMPMPTSIGPSTPTDPSKSRNRLHLALDRFKIVPGPDRIRRTGRGKAPINDSAKRLRSDRKT
jgi:hypothetical protein